MTLKLKVIILTIGLLAATAGLNFGVLHSFIMPAFTDLEASRAERDVRRIKGVFHAEMQEMKYSTDDWASWTETYNFMVGDDPEQKNDYQRINLNFDTLEGLHLNLFLIYDEQNRLVWSSGRSPNETEVSLDEMFGEVPRTFESYLREGRSFESLNQGFILTEQGPMLLTTHPILRNDDSGPPAGTLVFGRIIDERAIASIETQIQGNIDLVTADAALDYVSAEQWASLRGDYRKVHNQVTSEKLYTYAAIPNMIGQGELLIRIHTPRDITILGEKALVATILVMLVIGMITLVLVLYFIRAEIVRPMHELSNVMEALMEGTHDIEVPVHQKRHEFGRIAHTLEAFRQNLQERDKMEMSLQRAYEELEQEHAIQEQLTHQLEVAKDEAEMASRTKTAFLANMSHELRTPLNAVIGFSSTMEKEVFGPLGHQKYKEYVTDIAASGEHLLGIINDILDVSKVEAGKLELMEEVVDVHDLLQSTLVLTSERAQHAGVHLKINAADSLPHINADRRKLKQVMLNLVTNAIKFTDKDGRVTIAVEIAKDGDLLISVVDTGIGIAAHELEKVLAPFGRAQTPRDRNYEGTGLGLPLSKSLVELHGGSLTIASVLGTGTTIVVRIPKSRLLFNANAALSQS